MTVPLTHHLLGRPYTIPQTGLQPKERIFSQFQHLDVQGQGDGRSASSPSPCVLTRSSWCSTPRGSLRPRSLFSQGHLSSGSVCPRMASSQLSHLLKGAVSKPSPSGEALASSMTGGEGGHKSAQNTDRPFLSPRDPLSSGPGHAGPRDWLLVRQTNKNQVRGSHPMPVVDVGGQLGMSLRPEVLFWHRSEWPVCSSCVRLGGCLAGCGPPPPSKSWLLTLSPGAGALPLSYHGTADG